MRPPSVGRLLTRTVTTRSVLTALGAASLLGAIVLAFLPVPLPGLRGPVTAVANSTTVFLLGLTAGVLGAVRLHRATDGAESEAPSLGVPEAANYGSVGATGRELDRTIEQVDGTLAEPRPSEWWAMRERETVEDEIRRVAVAVLVKDGDRSHEEASAMLDAGTWTDDPRARSFLGGDAAPDPPLTMQFYDWLSGEAYDRHVEHTVDEIADRAGITEVETE